MDYYLPIYINYKVFNLVKTYWYIIYKQYAFKYLIEI